MNINCSQRGNVTHVRYSEPLAHDLVWDTQCDRQGCEQKTHDKNDKATSRVPTCISLGTFNFSAIATLKVHLFMHPISRKRKEKRKKKQLAWLTQPTRHTSAATKPSNTRYRPFTHNVVRYRKVFKCYESLIYLTKLDRVLTYIHVAAQPAPNGSLPRLKQSKKLFTRSSQEFSKVKAVATATPPHISDKFWA